MLGGYISDLEKGDVFKPVEYVITPFMVSEYAHGVEESSPYFHSARNPAGRQLRPPTMIHVDKMRILEANCDRERRIGGAKGQTRACTTSITPGGTARPISETVIVTGRIVDKYVKRGRQYLWYYLELRTSDGRLVTTYNDQTLLRYKKVGEE